MRKGVFGHAIRGINGNQSQARAARAAILLPACGGLLPPFDHGRYRAGGGGGGGPRIGVSQWV
ncbi:hypothetical protein EV192_111163 [Actinocrispum wychmicini]|uniref:Uncharacterized protein n=1 Tax=Actinocrispum wychmicini TaxID=1213861 RepID=A0A4R2JAI0_9PSEU|nr:hypothetical protein EV192_111163 [Actinocrispum wychmicini]